jgi:hypothetical protein
MQLLTTRALVSLFFTVMGALLLGCGGGGSDNKGGTTPSFSIALNPSTLSIDRGSNGTTVLSLQASNGFTGNITTLTQSGLPSGVSAQWSQSSQTSYTVNVAVTVSAVPGAYPFTLTATAGNAPNATANGTLTIPGAGQPGFSLGVSPSSLSVARGTAATSTITITGSNGFSGSVALSASGLPAGVTAAFSPATATTSSTLTLTASASATTGASTITLTGQSSGVANASTTLSLSVTQPSGGTQVSMTPCLQENDVIFFAVQDGGGPWTPVTGSGGTYTFALASGRGAVAITLRNQRFPDEIYSMILMGSTSELAQQMQGPCPGFQSVSGTYTAGAGNTVSVSLGIAGITNLAAAAGGSGPWTTSTVMKKPSGDLFAAESFIGGATVKCILRRDIPLSGANPPIGGDLNFFGAEAFVPDSAAISLSGLGAGYLTTAICHLWNPGLDVGVVGSSFSFSGGNPPPVAVVPAAKLRASDLQGITVTAMPADYGTSNGTSAMLLSQYWMATPADVTLNFLSAAAPPSVAIFQSLPHPRLRFTSTFASPYTNAFLFNVVQTAGNSSRGWQVLLSPGWVSAGGSWPVDTPEFTGLAGWNTAWDLWAGSSVLWMTTNSAISGGSRVDGSRQWTCNYSSTLIP